MGALDSILSSVQGGAGQSPAERLFGAGLSSLATGNLVALGATIVSELLNYERVWTPLCTYDLNPLNIDREGQGELATFWHGDPFRLVPHQPGLAMQSLHTELRIEADYAPEEMAPCLETSGPSWSAGKNFEMLWQLIQTSNPKAPSGGDVQTQHARASVLASWKILTKKEAWQRYKLETLPSILQVVGSESHDSQKLAAVESFYGGRVVDGQWRWGDEAIEGIAIQDWPRWIPLDSDAAALRVTYRNAWFEHGLSDLDLEVMSTLDPVTGIAPAGTSLEVMTPTDRKRYLCRAVIVAAAKARGNYQAFNGAVRQIESIGGPVDCSDDEVRSIGGIVQRVRAAGVDPSRAREVALSMAQTSSQYGSKWIRWTVFALVGAGAAGAGLSWWMKRGRKRKRGRK